jgi:hypothetical protein
VEEPISTERKALKINLDSEKFGTFAEIGAGQEVVRWFFHVGRASTTVAKAISAYDMAVSDELYGATERYVSRQRLASMLDHEYALLLKRMEQKRREKTDFFVFADTAATHTRPGHHAGHAWLGVRFQTQPQFEPSETVVHVQLLDAAIADQQAALGILGVNLIHGAFFHHNEPNRLIGELMDGLRRERAEVDMIKLSGPAFAAVDNRLMSLLLLEQNLTDVAMFTVDGEVEQASEVLSGKPVLIERGGFRPVTNVTKEMLDRAVEQLHEDPGMESKDLVVLMEMTLNNLMMEHVVDHQDFLARVDTLSALGKMVMISNYTRFDHVTSYLRKYTQNWIAMVLGAPTLSQILDEKYYADVEGGMLEGLGRLCHGKVKLYVYPMKTSEDGTVIDARALPVAPASQKLYAYLLESGKIEPIRQFEEEQLHIYPGEVLAKIQAGEEDWDRMVPPAVAKLIRERELFGYKGGNERGK